MMKFPIEINDNKISLLNSYDDIIKVLENIDEDSFTMFIYLNIENVKNILSEEDEIININDKNMHINSLKSLFYLGAFL